MVSARFAALTALASLAALSGADTRQVIPFNSGWRFLRAESATASDPATSDSSWQPVSLPHDWNLKDALPGTTLHEAENVPETAEAERIMEGMIQQGAKLIFATSFGHQQSAFNLSKKHPDVIFEHAGGWMLSANFGNFFGVE